MLLNARRIPPGGKNPELILLAIEDITERKQMEAAVEASEIRYRRLFEAAKDGILILNVSSAKIIDANPFMSDLLGYPREYFLEKEFWEIGLFQDIRASQAAFKELQKHRYLRYDDLPLKTNHGGQIAVELVSNLYQEDQTEVIQCNIRDISERSRLEKALVIPKCAIAGSSKPPRMRSSSSMQHRENLRCQSVHQRDVGLFARRTRRQGTLADRSLPRSSREPSRFR